MEKTWALADAFRLIFSWLGNKASKGFMARISYAINNPSKP